MNIEGFRQFLLPRQLPDGQVEQHIRIVSRFEAYVASLNPPMTLESASAEAAQRPRSLRAVAPATDSPHGAGSTRFPTGWVAAKVAFPL